MSQPRSPLASPWFAGALLLALAVWVADLAVLRAGVPHPLDDTWEEGLVASHLLRGEGFRTRMIHPPLWELRDPETLAVPLLVHGPLLPLLHAAPLAVLGPRALDHAAWWAALAATLAVVPIFRLAARLDGERAAAFAAACFTLSPLTIAAVNHYASVVVGALLVAVCLDLLWRERPRPLAAGVAAGVCALARPEMVLALPALAWLAAGAGRLEPRPPPAAAAAGWRAAALLGFGFAAAAGWWWVERWRISGLPFFNLTAYLLASFSPAHPGDALFRDFAARPEAWPRLLAEALPGLPRKWADTFPRGVKRALTTPSAGAAWLVALGLVEALRRPALRRALPALAVLALIPIGAITLLAPVRLYPVPFLPLYALAAGLGAAWAARRLGSGRRGAALGLAVVAVATLPFAALELREQAREARRLERWLAADRAALRLAAGAGGARPPRPMVSDTPDFVAWTTGRPTVWLTLEELVSLHDAGRLPAGLPPPRPEDTWFHPGDPRHSAGQRGFRFRLAEEGSGR